jgi:hypothetical protein
MSCKINPSYKEKYLLDANAEYEKCISVNENHNKIADELIEILKVPIYNRKRVERKINKINIVHVVKVYLILIFLKNLINKNIHIRYLYLRKIYQNRLLVY